MGVVGYGAEADGAAEVEVSTAFPPGMGLRVTILKDGNYENCRDMCALKKGGGQAARLSSAGK
jgi:hypothetical protein